MLSPQLRTAHLIILPELTARKESLQYASKLDSLVVAIMILTLVPIPQTILNQNVIVIKTVTNIMIAAME